MNSRYHRQEILPQIEAEGQSRIAAARVALIGCGALGTVMAEMLARAGIGHLRIIDRDIVELSNLQRQTLFTEADARDGGPKAIAAAERLRQINSEIVIEAMAVDVDSGNVDNLVHSSDSQLATVRRSSPQARNPQLHQAPTLALPRSTRGGDKTVDIIFDGTDNVETRYLINDAAVKHNIPWVYAAAVGTEGRVMGIMPAETPCLQCVFPNPPAANELATCDTAGVLAAASGMIASLAVAEGMKLLLGHRPRNLIAVDVWESRFSLLDLEGNRNEKCVCCGERKFEFLERLPASDGAKLCGRNAVQIRGKDRVDLRALSERLAGVGEVQSTAHMLRVVLHDSGNVILSVFPDGRVIVTGTADMGRARSLVARFLGA